jgi:hypothetical protein
VLVDAKGGASFQTKRGIGPLCGVWLGRSTSMSST